MALTVQWVRENNHVFSIFTQNLYYQEENPSKSPLSLSYPSREIPLLEEVIKIQKKEALSNHLQSRYTLGNFDISSVYILPDPANRWVLATRYQNLHNFMPFQSR